MFFVLIATLKASVFSASLWRPAVQRLRKRPSTKNNIFPSPLRITSRPPPANTKLPIIPHSVLVFQLHNRVLITESPSHMKSQTSTVTSHIYLGKWLWQTSAGPCLSSMLFLVFVLLEAMKVRLKKFSTCCRWLTGQLCYIINQSPFQRSYY